MCGQYRLTTSVHSNWQLKALQNARLDSPLDIYLKVNSGMNRLGFRRSGYTPSGSSCGHATWAMTLMSHFAEAEDRRYGRPMQRIEQAAEGLDLHVAGQLGGNAMAPGTHFDWVRPGIML
ncbi:alanine racemase [Shigella flexneri]